MTTSPLRESTRNTSTEGITPASSWSTTSSSTSPLRVSRRDSPLTSGAVPNHHYHRLPTQLARRQSSSYNHVRNNNLVSKSPFKVHAGFKPSRIPTPSRAIKDDENKPELGFKRRQSRGLSGLVKEQPVTKSPFLGDRRTVTTDIVPPIPRCSKPEPRVTPSPEVTESQPSTSPLPCTPRNPRVADLSGVSPSPSPRPSSLVSPKRLHGPRSLSASPASENGKRQRRKTVTFDERCDVLEFDQDEISENAIDTEDEDDYGAPEPPSPTVSASTDRSLLSDEGAYVMQDSSPKQDVRGATPSLEEKASEFNIEQPGRSPRISRDEIRRRLMEQRVEDLERTDLSSQQPTPDASLDVSSQSLGCDSFSDTKAQHASQSDLSDNDVFLEKKMGAPFDFNTPGVDLGEIHSALDRFMRGVESSFDLDPAESESAETETAGEGDTSVNGNPSTALSDISADTNDVEIQARDGKERQVTVEMADIPHVLGTDEDTDTPVTPPLTDHHTHKPSTPDKDESFLSGAPSFNDSLPGTPTPTQGDDSILLASHDDLSGLSLTGAPVVDMSATDLIHEDAVQTSTPPRLPREVSHPSDSRSSPRLAQSGLLALPPLSFDPPSDASKITGHELRSNIPAPRASLLKTDRDDPFIARTPSTASNHSIPPPVPPKDHSAIQQRDEFVKARRREMQADRDRERPATYHEGRPSRRRSLSTGDAEDLGSNKPASQRRAGLLRDDHDLNLLDVPLEHADEDDALGDIIERELKIRRKPTVKGKDRKYQLRERENTIYASADEKVSHMSQVGDVDSGKAWRTVRRPSDMNEYSRQIKEYRSQQKPGKAHGKVFVKVMGVRGLNVPLPREPTAFTCTLNNGIHFVTTPECRLDRDSRIEQEFELIEHSKLEFTLTLKVRRDPHIEAQAKSNLMPPILLAAAAPPPPPPPASSRGGVRGFFGVGGSPKKAHKVAVAAAVRATPEPVEDNLARYLKHDGTLARSFISFKEIAKRCDTRLFETSFPLIGQRTDGSSTSPANPWTMGELVLQIFRLPPLPGIPPSQLPQSLEECHRGLRHINWHKVTYHEGVLTQNGGDCRTWRRRLLRVIGSNLVAFNDVTKKVTATIDLKKAIGVEDDDRSPRPITSPASAATARSRDEFDEVYRVERSFRLIFPNEEEISFFADNDESKARWLEVFRALVGHIPPNPLWAELIWQRQEELAKLPPASSVST